jgi:hypothetical protein
MSRQTHSGHQYSVKLNKSEYTLWIEKFSSSWIPYTIISRQNSPSLYPVLLETIDVKLPKWGQKSSPPTLIHHFRRFEQFQIFLRTLGYPAVLDVRQGLLLFCPVSYLFITAINLDKVVPESHNCTGKWANASSRIKYKKGRKRWYSRESVCLKI